MKKKHLLFFSLVCSTGLFAQTVGTFTGTAGTAGTSQSSSIPLSTAAYDGPSNLFVDNSGKMWITEVGGNRVRMVDQITTPSSATVYLRAGSASGAPGALEGTGVNARFNTPSGVVVAEDGTIYIADLDNNCIRKIVPFTDLATSQLTSTFAGTKGVTGGYQDAQGTAAQFNQPSDLAIDGNGNLYVADAGNNRIRKITPDGTVTTLAGDGTVGSTDATGTAASFAAPKGLCWYSATELLVADMSNGKIRKIDITNGKVSTVAGTGNAGTDDGDALTQATFRSPMDVAVDGHKNIYVTDAFPANTIRKISGSCVTTFAGTAGNVGSGDGTGANASFNNPTGILFSNNMLYVCDQGNHTIRSLSVPTMDERPAVAFDADLTSGTSTDVFTFSDHSSNAVAWEWIITPTSFTFQNGTTEHSQNPKITFTAAGDYSVKLKITSSCWGDDTLTKTDYIHVGSTGINDINAASFIQLYPNPAKDLVEVTFSEIRDTHLIIRVTDIHGKVIYEQPAHSTKETINMANAAKGIYLVSIVGSQYSITKKLVIE